MALGDLLNQTVTIENPSSGRDKHGGRSFGTPFDTPCRFQKKNKTILSASGGGSTGQSREREPIDGEVYVGNVTVVKGAKATYQGTAYRVMTVDEVVGGGGAIHHLELLVQLWSYA